MYMGQTLSNTFNRYKPDMFKTDEEKALDRYFSQSKSQRQEKIMESNHRLKMSEQADERRRFKNTHGNNQARFGNRSFRLSPRRGAGGGRKSKGRKSKGRKYYRRRTSKLYRKNKRKSKNKRKKRKRRTSKY